MCSKPARRIQPRQCRRRQAARRRVDPGWDNRPPVDQGAAGQRRVITGYIDAIGINHSGTELSGRPICFHRATAVGGKIVPIQADRYAAAVTIEESRIFQNAVSQMGRHEVAGIEQTVGVVFDGEVFQGAVARGINAAAMTAARRVPAKGHARGVYRAGSGTLAPLYKPPPTPASLVVRE